MSAHAAPSGRRYTLRRTVGMLAVLVAAGAPARAQTPVADAPRDARPTVAVLYFTNGALVGNADYAPLSKGMADMMITELARNTGVRVVERDRLQHLLDEQNLGSGDRVDKETAVKLGKLLGAHHLLTGAFVIDPKQNVRIDVRSINTETSAIEYVETINGKADDLLAMIGQLGTKVNAGLKLPQLAMRAPTLPAKNASGGGSFRAMMLMSRAIEQQDKGNVQGAIALYRSSMEADPSFERPKILLASLEQKGGRPTP